MLNQDYRINLVSGYLKILDLSHDIKEYYNGRNILVTGGNGQLGSELKELAPAYSNYHFIFTDVENLDI